MEVSVYATKDQIEELKSSVIWSDIVRELETWREGFDDEMRNVTDDSVTDNLSTASVLLHMGDLNGRQKAVNYMIGILDVFLSILEAKEIEEPKEEEPDEER